MFVYARENVFSHVYLYVWGNSYSSESVAVFLEDSGNFGDKVMRSKVIFIAVVLKKRVFVWPIYVSLSFCTATKEWGGTHLRIFLHPSFLIWTANSDKSAFNWLCYVFLVPGWSSAVTCPFLDREYSVSTTLVTPSQAGVCRFLSWNDEAKVINERSRPRIHILNYKLYFY
jgi:hypothetical protein